MQILIGDWQEEGFESEEEYKKYIVLLGFEAMNFYNAHSLGPEIKPKGLIF